MNDRGRATVKALSTAYELARPTSARFIMLGDVFDTTRPEPQLIAATQHVIKPDHRSTTTILMGNHDQVSSQKGDHALGPLGELEGVAVFERPAIDRVFSHLIDVPDVEVWCVPYEAGPATEWLPKRLDELAIDSDPKCVRVLALHLGIHDVAMRQGAAAHWIDKANDAIKAELLAANCFKHGIRAAVAGNWHTRRHMQFSVTEDATVDLFQVGALTPTGWDNAGLEGYGGVLLMNVDTQKTTFEFAEVPGPRFVKVESYEELDGFLKHPGVRYGYTKLYVSWSCKPEQLAEIRAVLTELQEEGVIAGWQAPLDKTDVEAQARAAAKAAQSTTTLMGVLDAFVAKMPVAENVSREKVFERCRAYLETSK